MKKERYATQSMELSYMRGEGAEKGGAVGFGDVKIVKPVLFHAVIFCGALFRVQYADCVGSRMKSLALEGPMAVLIFHCPHL